MFNFFHRLIYNLIIDLKFYDYLQFLSFLGFKVYKNDKQKISYKEAINLSDKAVESSNQLYLKRNSFKRLEFVVEGKYGWIFKYMSDVVYDEFFYFHVLVDKLIGVRFIIVGLEKEQFFINYYSRHRDNISVFYDKLIDLHIDMWPHPYNDPDFYKKFQIEE